MAKKPKNTKIETLTHEGQTRKNIPTAELENLIRDEEAKPKKVDYRRKNNPNEIPELYARNLDLDPQLVWKGKDEEDQEPLSVDAVPIYVQEQIHPKAIIEDIKRQSKKETVEKGKETPDLFANWPRELSFEDKIEFYQHDQRWTNRMILGDSLQVMTSLSEKEGLKGQVQCIYMDPPYGISYASNWQTSTNNRTVRDGQNDSESREAEVIRAFRDTWEFGINSYLSYLRDRLTVCRELLTETGSIFFQIGDENEHLVRSLLDEVFGSANFVSKIVFKKTLPLGSKGLAGIYDIILWYGKDASKTKFRRLFEPKEIGDGTGYIWLKNEDTSKRKMSGKERQLPEKNLDKSQKPFFAATLSSSGFTKTCIFDFNFEGKQFKCGRKSWRTTEIGMERLIKADRIIAPGKLPTFITYHDDFPVQPIHNMWTDTHGALDTFYVVQTSNKVVQRCILMATDPGDLVIDPTCGSGTTAAVSEEWGRRWITIDASRVSLALARARLIGSKFEWYDLADKHPSQGFRNKKVPHITLSSIANNLEIDVIWDRWYPTLEQYRQSFNNLAQKDNQSWDMPSPDDTSFSRDANESLLGWWAARKDMQTEIDNSISSNADYEELYDKPLIQKNILRVTGPFTVESLSPHRIVPADADDEALLQQITDESTKEGGKIPEQKSKRLRPKSVEEGETKFLDIVQENLAKAGVQNTKKGERLEFIALDPWLNGRYIQFEGRYMENSKEKKAAIFVGPEYGTVTKSLMSQAAKEAADYFDILVVLGFAFEAHADEDVLNIGRLPVLRARMNNDLHMADRLKSGKSGNLFVVFGEPDIELLKADGDKLKVEIKGVDIFDPTTGDIKASGPDDIACWFIDTDYNDEAFFVRHAYFSGGGPDPFKRLKTTLKAEINEEAWSSLYSTVSRPFEKPSTGRIAVKAINHYGDEVLKVFDV